MEHNTKDTRLIFNYGVTRSLLAAGCEIVDIKADRDNEVTGKEKCIHVFKNNDVFKREFSRIKKEIAAAKDAQAE